MRKKSNSLFKQKQNSQQPHAFRGGEIKVMKKKIAAFVLAAALVLPTSLTAFAATPTDVVGKKEQSAVEELIALGVIKGYEDGTFKPANDITRAELAKVIVIASGNEGAASLMAGVKPSFTDVKAGAWYTGYINVAATKGFVQGYNGKFRPSDNVKFEEVVAVLVRALGYKEIKLSGAWPYNYLLKAQDVGLFNGVDITAGALANRGVVAKLTSNTINSSTVVYDVNGAESFVGQTNLIAKIGNTSSAVLSAPTVTDKKVNLNGTDVAVADSFLVTGGKSLAELVGHTVTVVKTKDQTKVLAISDAQPADKIVAVENDGVADVVSANGTITVKDAKAYTTAATPAYLGFQGNFVAKEIGTDSLAAGAKATLFLNADGKVQFVNVVTYSANAQFASYEAKTSFRDARINLVGGGFVTIKDSATVKLDGKVVAPTELKDKDVVKYVLTAGTNAAIVEATRNTVTGKVEKVKTGTNTYYTVAGKEYQDLSGDTLTLGSEYVLYLDADGKIFDTASANAASTSNYAVAIKAATPNVDVVVDGEIVENQTKLELFSVKENKNVVVYLDPSKITQADGPDLLTEPDLYAPVDNAVLKLTYSSAGKITDAYYVGTATGGAQVTDVTATQIKAASTYLVNSNTVYINATQRTSDVIATGTAASITKNDTVAFIANADGINADVVILLTDSDAAAASATVYGTFVAQYEVQESASVTKQYVTLNVNGEEKSFLVTEDLYGDLDAENPTVINAVTLEDEVASFGEYEGYDLATTDVTSLVVNSASAQTFTTNVDSYIVTGKTVVYYVDAANKVSVASFSIIGDAAANALGALGTGVEVYVVDSGSSLGAYKEAAVVVVKKN
jgi:hypothetical protein